MSQNYKGQIDKPGDDVSTKYVVQVFVPNAETGITKKHTYNINADVTVPSFGTKPAKQRSLDVTVSDSMQTLGFDTFTGSIGDGRIYIRTAKGVVMKGEILGGPEDGQTFVGSGTWSSAWRVVVEKGCENLTL